MLRIVRVEISWSIISLESINWANYRHYLNSFANGPFENYIFHK